jgi:XRE family transcriptional regulator, fatty acid utilization regulator
MEPMRSTAPRKRNAEDIEALRLLGERIRALRRSKIIAQDALAHKAEIPRTHMTAIEGGRVDPKLTMLRRIARALAVSVHDLINIDLPIDQIVFLD